MQQFFTSLTEAASEVPRALVGVESGSDWKIKFPMGRYTAEVNLPGVTETTFLEVLHEMRRRFATDTKISGVVVATFLDAVKRWPATNPSDIWYFFMSHAFQDPYNHPARDANKNWDQSWRRTGGWALETVVATHYNPFLTQYGIELQVLTGNNPIKYKLLEPMKLAATAAEKLDVLAIGEDVAGRKHCFGALHVKASLAERRSDDESSSRELIARGFLSSLVTMDCKATPAPAPINRGEFGAVGTDGVEALNKRLEVENVRVFDAVFSYNTRTIPTPAGQAAAARIHVVSFQNPNDMLGRHIVDSWKRRTGQN